MTIYLAILGIGILIGAGVLYLCLRRKLIVIKKDNSQLIAEEQKLTNSIENLNTSIREKQNQSRQIEDKIKLLQQTEDSEISNLQRIQLEAKQFSASYYESEMEKVKIKIDAETKTLEDNLETNAKECDEAYLEVLQDNLNHYLSEDSKLKEKIKASQIEADKIKASIEELVAQMAAAVEVNKRLELERTEKDFYRLQLSEADLEEIQRLRQVSHFLRDKEPLNKVIYKTYYEKPYNALIGRIIGSQKKSGIYKITNIENGMCYIGQSVDLAERLRQHIKRGVGAEPVTRNKLYPAMFAIGPENFTFEIVEECDSSKLNDREKYWIEYCKSKEFGYNATSGGA